MQNAPPKTVVDVVTDFLATEPSPQEVIAYHLPARLDHLLDKKGEGLLTNSEKEELTEFLNTDEVFSLLKTKMKLKLRNDPMPKLQNKIL